MSYSDFERGISSMQLAKIRQREGQEALRRDMQDRWQESARILGILRSFGSVPHSADSVEKWFNQLRGVPRYATSLDDTHLNTPNDWFCRRFPKVRARFGEAFLDDSAVNIQSMATIRCKVMNEDFFAAMLGGEESLGHRVVYLPGEGFLYLDPQVDAYVNTSEQKLEILLSNYLIKCASDMGAAIDKGPLINEHRRPQVLSMIVRRAKTILEADPQFFQPQSHNRRFKNGRFVDVSPASSPEHFIHHALAAEPGACVLVGEAYQEFLRHCQIESLMQVSFQDFKKVAKNLIMEKYQLGLRHDIKTDAGRQSHGWKNLRLRQSSVANVSSQNVPELGENKISRAVVPNQP